MRRFTRGAAALILGTTLSAVAAAQTPRHSAGRDAADPARRCGGRAAHHAAGRCVAHPGCRADRQARRPPDRQRRDREQPADPRGRGLSRPSPVPARPAGHGPQGDHGAPDREHPHRPVPERHQDDGRGEGSRDRHQRAEGRTDDGEEGLHQGTRSDDADRGRVPLGGRRPDEVGEVHQAAVDGRQAEATVRRPAPTCSTARWSAPGTS